MTYLGLDVASRCGYALFRPGEDGERPVITCGSWDCSKGGGEPGDVLSDRLTSLIRRYRADGFPVRAAAIEAPIRKVPTRSLQDRHGQWQEVLAGNAHTMFVLNTMYGAARAILRQFNVPTDAVAASSWRKLTLGVGRTPKGEDSNWFKREMRRRAGDIALRFGFEVPNHDAADALGIAIWLVAQTGHLPAGVMTGRGPTLFAGHVEAAE